jgi:hypothetical protein
MIKRAVEKIRQAGDGMPAVMIRQLEVLGRVMDHTKTERQRAVVALQATMILQASETSVSEEQDRADIRRAYDTIDMHRSLLTDRHEVQLDHSDAAADDVGLPPPAMPAQRPPAGNRASPMRRP